MKKKTIESILVDKHLEWFKSIKDEAVQNLVKKNSIITGGCIASMLLGEKVNDYDVYFTNKETVKAVAEYYVKIWNETNNEKGKVLDGAEGDHMNMTADRIKIFFQSEGVVSEKGVRGDLDDEIVFEQDDTKPKYRPVFISPNAITLSDDIQIVLRFYGNPDEIHQHYDYVHCTNYWLSKDGKLTLKQPALEALLARELIYVGSKYPIASLIRTRKFIKRGYTINAGQYLKMAFQISELDLKDINVLEDQLIGVDVAYFFMLIKALGNNSGVPLTYSYLATIIDRIF